MVVLSKETKTALDGLLQTHEEQQMELPFEFRELLLQYLCPSPHEPYSCSLTELFSFALW